MVNEKQGIKKMQQGLKQLLTNRWLFRSIRVIGMVTFGTALLLYAYLGIFSRYYADDYCLTSSFLTDGFWKSQIGLYLAWSNRYAVAFILNLSEYLGRSAIQGWPAFVVVLWVAALGWMLRQVGRSSMFSFSTGTALLFAEILVFFTVLEAPQQYQSIYWRVGLITYTLPLVLLCFLVGLIINRAQKADSRRRSWVGGLACALLAFFAGGFSETYVALQTALLGMTVLGVLLSFKSTDRRKWLVPVGAALIGSFLALFTVILAPGNAVRLSAIPESRPPFISLIRLTISSAFVFIYASLKYYSFQNVLSLLTPMLIVYALYSRQEHLGKLRPTPLIQALFLVPVVGFLLIMAVCAPSAYAESSYPEARALIEARFIMEIMLMMEGAVIGMSLRQLHNWADESPTAFLQLLTAALFLAAAVYPLYDARKTYLQIPLYQNRAAIWDAHAAVIRTSLEQGQLDVNIHDNQARSFDEFSGLLEIGSDPKYWINQCAASFFGVHNLAINQPNP